MGEDQSGQSTALHGTAGGPTQSTVYAVRRITKQQILPVKAAILAKRQDGKCPLCGKSLTLADACLDHDHFNGRIRGVLCRNCNGIEGKIKNLVVRGKRTNTMEDYLGNIILYWLHHKTDRTGLLHPLHLSDEEKRIKRNTKARKARAKKKKDT